MQKNKSVLYNLVFGCNIPDVPEEMFFNRRGHVSACGSALVLDESSTLQFDTYFNSFSIDKWRDYTEVEEVFLELQFSGSFTLKLYELSGKQTLTEARYSSSQVTAVRIPVEGHGVIGFDIQAHEETILYAGAYTCSQSSQKKSVHIAMCTYMRERYVQKNVETLLNSVAMHPELDGTCNLYLADNGQTLREADFPSRYVKVLPQNDLGGTAGNMRALLEILPNANEDDYVVFMDDDVAFLPTTLQRLQSFISYLKPEYQDREIAGAMFEMERPFMQHESAAIFTGMETVPIHTGLDMRLSNCVAANEDDAPGEYAAGFLRAIPIKLIQKKGTYFPAFIRFDDVEYGLRIGKPPITLNGIMVWHDSFCYKDNAAVCYYNFRNMLVAEALHPRMSIPKKLLHINRMALWYSLCLHYNCSRAIIQGVEDFLKGPQWMSEVDGEQLHNELTKLNYKYIPVSQEHISGGLLCNRFHRKDFKGKREVWIVNERNHTGYCVRKSLNELVLVLMNLAKLNLRFFLKYPDARKQFRKRFPASCGLNYWKKIYDWR